MFGKKKEKPQIDKEQLELIKNAQQRVKQKKRLYYHFVIFLIGALFLILANTVLGIGQDLKIFGQDWFVIAIIVWLFLFVFHLFNVFVTHKFMGKEWEEKQLTKLVNKQKVRIEKLKAQLEKEDLTIAESQVFNQKNNKIVDNLTMIVAAGENNEIGKDNDLIWHLRDDLKRFKSLTSGHHIIMGRKTFESFPKPLPNRTHIVITRQSNYKAPDGVIIVNSIEDAINIAKKDSQPFIIGGGEIYKQAMPYASKIEITRVHATFPEADTFFPKIDTSIFEETSNVFHKKDDNHQYEFSFLTFERI
ncbi:dihydrofolate reductase [Mesoflavibacter sabulilitoris]|uniref:dihydrofolate reductase n=1 Tax=Mesoflavibacter zeaxanthinifaciens subsp. sabulilitoris TaxID=1520893 RepID=A0A2T1NLT4_9FLAO|nr:dihydrofolate reductase [Mesoflavibacter zeaxanthinifaciens]MBB3124485.1 dihydrofolate reductase [Mesoflavibacter zeaxanthinifaciens subsp. sabulilitoris]PSG93855.1 dihydrofolate reductase [Mesoflavibacter zeaxanthinifaciens subsp. sabulilitoris]